MSGPVRQSFSAPARGGRLSVIPFLPAGYPSLSELPSLCRAAAEGGADLVEIGFPFSDPVADGPVIQAAFNHALDHGVTVDGIFSTLAQGPVGVPLAAMVSYSIIYRYGTPRFFAAARRAGFSGVILPDLPLPEAAAVTAMAWQEGLETTLLVAPSTPVDRQREIVSQCTGFVYYLSVAGVTGERRELPPDLGQHVARLKAVSGTPVAVGFGISTPEHVRSLVGVADGAIIGSALVRRLVALEGVSPAQRAEGLKEAVAQLKGPTLA